MERPEERPQTAGLLDIAAGGTDMEVDEDRPQTSFDVFENDDEVFNSSAQTDMTQLVESFVKLIENRFRSQTTSALPTSTPRNRLRASSSSSASGPIRPNFREPMMRPSQSRNWEQPTDVIISTKGKVMKVFGNCKFKWRRNDREGNMEWRCSERSWPNECPAKIVTLSNDPYEVVNASQERYVISPVLAQILTYFVKG